MKSKTRIFRWSVIVLVAFTFCVGFKNDFKDNALNGAWQWQDGNNQRMLLFADGYFSYTAFDNAKRKFTQTTGGPFTIENNRLTIKVEFNTDDKNQVGELLPYKFSVSNNQLSLTQGEKRSFWKKVDDGTENLAGTWKITARKQDGTITPIHQTGARKTLKILTGTRFQWVAINPETKEFFGTGGGNYTFKEGKYTENIEFFSRDSSRVGASLSFDGKLEKDGWHHSGKSSKGDDIYEVWNRMNEPAKVKN